MSRLSRSTRFGFAGLFVATLCVTVLLARCGGSSGGGGGSGGTPVTGSISGTAAKGAAISSATVTVKDRDGNSRTATTGADGKYTLDVTGMTAPFLVKLEISGVTLFSVGNAAGTINVTPLTDLIVKNYYLVNGTTATDAFDGLTATTPAPSADTVKIIASTVVQVMRQWLQSKGVDATSFDPIATAFDANGSGVDGVLDITVINAGGTSITVTSGGTTQTTTVSVSATDGTATFDTTTTNGVTTSTSSITTVIPKTAADEAVIAGVNTALSELKAAIAAKGENLASSDILAFLATDFKDQGTDRDYFAASLATNLRGGFTIQKFQAVKLLSYDATAKKAQVEVNVVVTQGGRTQEENFRFFFKEEGGKYLLSGDQRLAQLGLKLENRRDISTGTDTGFKPSINVDVDAPQNTVTSVTLTGQGFGSGTQSVPKSGVTRVRTIRPTPGGSSQSVNFDAFFLNSSNFGNLSPVPPAGTAYTFVATPASGSAQTYVTKLNASTNDTITLGAGWPSSYTLASAQLGAQQTFRWTLPTTFAVVKVQFNALTFTGANNTGFQCELDENDITYLTGNAGATFTIPTTCNGAAVLNVNYNLSAEGPSGERVQIIMMMAN